MRRARGCLLIGLTAVVVFFAAPISPLTANTAPAQFVDITATALPEVAKESDVGLWELWLDDDDDGFVDRKPSYGIAWGDVDGDGLLDLYVNNHLGDRFGPPPTLYMNRGNGTFQNELNRFAPGPDGAIVNGDRHGSSFVDIDNDGDKDLLQLVGLSVDLERSRNKIYINEGGQFVNEAAERGIAYAESRAREITLLDVDNDGLLDFLHGSLADGNRPVEAPPTIFTQNNDGSFTDSGAALGHQYQQGYGLEYGILTDLDSDGSPELVQKQPFQVFDTSGPTLQDITNSVFTSVSGENARGLTGMEIADFNGDTVPDFFLPSWVSSNHQLILSTPDGWMDASVASNIRSVDFRTPDGAGVVAGDFDNDADIDMIVVDRDGGNDYLLSNDGSGVFTPTVFTLTQRTTALDNRIHRSIASVDFNNDGALDVTETTSRNDPTHRLLENTTNGNDWLGIVLEGTTSNRDGVGATVQVTTGDTTQTRFQRGGLNFRVQSDSRLHFGLGTSASIDEIRIIWPSGIEEVITGASPNQYLQITEGSGTVAPPTTAPPTTTTTTTTPPPALPPVLPSDGDRVTDHLIGLWTFDSGSGDTALDTSGYLAPLDLTIGDVDNVTWGDGTLSIDSQTLLSSSGPATKISEAIQASGELTIEAWVAPANLTQSGPARIVTLSSDPSSRNFTLGQTTDDYQVRLRTTTTGTNGVLKTVFTSSGLAETQLSHVVYTRDSVGMASIYVDGTPVAFQTIDGTLATWDSNFAFALGAELNGERPFLGTYDLVAIYDDALAPSEVAHNFAAGPESPAPGIDAPDTIDPTGDVTTPAAGSTTPTGTITIQGTATDDSSGINRVLVQIRRLTNPREYWNGTTWTTTPRWHTATLANNGNNTTWTLPGVNFNQTGDHQIVLNIRDNAGNTATSAENPITNFTIG